MCTTSLSALRRVGEAAELDQMVAGVPHASTGDGTRTARTLHHRFGHEMQKQVHGDDCWLTGSALECSGKRGEGRRRPELARTAAAGEDGGDAICLLPRFPAGET